MKMATRNLKKKLKRFHLVQANGDTLTQVTKKKARRRVVWTIQSLPHQMIKGKKMVRMTL